MGTPWRAHPARGSGTAGGRGAGGEGGTAARGVMGCLVQSRRRAGLAHVRARPRNPARVQQVDREGRPALGWPKVCAAACTCPPAPKGPKFDLRFAEQLGDSIGRLLGRERIRTAAELALRDQRIEALERQLANIEAERLGGRAAPADADGPAGILTAALSCEHHEHDKRHGDNYGDVERRQGHRRHGWPKRKGARAPRGVKRRGPSLHKETMPGRCFAITTGRRDLCRGTGAPALSKHAKDLWNHANPAPARAGLWRLRRKEAATRAGFRFSNYAERARTLAPRGAHHETRRRDDDRWPAGRNVRAGDRPADRPLPAACAQDRRLARLGDRATTALHRSNPRRPSGRRQRRSHRGQAPARNRQASRCDRPDGRQDC